MHALFPVRAGCVLTALLTLAVAGLAACGGTAGSETQPVVAKQL